MLTELAITAQLHTTPATGLHIYLLGPLRLVRDGTPIHLPRRKVESLLAYLLLHPEQHTRDHLATLFWGDSSDAEARHSLRTALATLRKAVAPDLLLTDRDHVQLNAAFPLWVDLYALLDVEVLLDSATNDVFQTKLALWQGELLTGFYDDWLLVEREYYGTRLLTLFLQATQALRTRSEYGLAIEVAQHILSFDPANEVAHQHLMFCYVAAGDRTAALRQYEFCVRALHDELDAPPLPETTALYQWIKQQDNAASSAAKITNLPIPFTSFVGRTRAMAEVKRLLLSPPPATRQPPTASNQGVRLLTLIGAGGSGKTRLAIQVATDLINSFAHGVWWVELAALTTGEQVARAVAKTLGISEVGNEPCLQSVLNFLADKQLLLVLDNCEHLVESCAHLVSALLRHSPNLQLLITTREPLNLTGEILWPVPPLSLPDPQQRILIDSLPHYECIQLFVERATAVQQSFCLTSENAPAVVEICAQLDGIPLAIELAAARVKVLPVEQIAARLNSALGARFDLLTQGSRAALPRHQTLRATIDWSYELLAVAERQLFQQVAIFRGGFTLAAIEQVVTLDNTLDAQHSTLSAKQPLLDRLTQLVDKSLVIVELQHGQNRYRLLETIREYALGQYPTADELAQTRQRHAQYYLAFAAQAAPQLIGPQQHAWLNRLAAEHANLSAALDYLSSHADGELALRLATAIYRFWEFRGYISEGRTWLHKALAQRGTATPYTQAKALNAAGYLALRQSDFNQAQRLLAESLALFEQCAEQIGVAEALQNLAAAHISQGEYPTAQQQLARSLSLCQSLNDDYGLARTLNLLGNMAVDQDRYTDALDYYQASLHHYQPSGDQVSIATSFFNIGNTARELGDSRAARTNYEACLTISRTLGHQGLTGVALRNLGVVAFDQQAYPQARAYAEEALTILRALGDKVNTGFALLILGDIARKLGESRVALDYYGQTLQILHAAGHKWGLFYSLEALASFFTEVGAQPAYTLRVLAAAHSLRQATSTPVPATEQADYARRLSELRQQLGNVAFDTLWAAGQTQPLAQILAEVSALSLA